MRQQMEDLTDLILWRVREKLSGEVLQRRSGRLYDSIQKSVVVVGDRVTGRVFSDGSVPYSTIQEQGGTTSPHDIVFRDAKALRFEIAGGTVFAARVHHPGSRIPAARYLGSTWAEFGSVIRDFFKPGKARL